MIPGQDPIVKVSIIPRGQALGVTVSLPERDAYQQKKSDLQGRIAVLLGGRVAEEEVFNDCTTGASSDLERATSIARSMVTRFAMVKGLGCRTFGTTDGAGSFLNNATESRDYSEATSLAIDEAVYGLTSAGEERARLIIKKHRDKLDAMANELLKKKTLGGKEIEALFGPRPTEIEA